MGIWKKLFGDADEQAVDYYGEGLALMRSGNYHEALTSLRLALRDDPGDVGVQQQIAIAYTRMGMTDDALRTYRTVLAQHETPGAHYGIAFLLLHQGKKDEAADHLRRFLASPPDDADAADHIEHAQKTLEELTADGDG